MRGGTAGISEEDRRGGRRALADLEMNGAESLICVPQAEELAPVVEVFIAAGHQPTRVVRGRLECRYFAGLGVLLAVGGHGKTQLAVQTQHLIERQTDLGVVICAGGAGRLASDVELGDVVVGTSTIEHDYKLRFARRPLPDHPADARLVDEFRLAASRIGPGFKVLFGAIASGDEDVVDPARARELREATGALCVAWEGAGAARAARFSGLRFLEVRAITDGADDTAAADFRQGLERSMPNLGQVLLEWTVVRRHGNPTPP